MLTTEFDDRIADRIRWAHRDLAARWFERLLELLPVDARDVFPTDSLLDHIPALILEIADYVQRPEDVALAANTALVDKARELGGLRHGQRASLHQVLREYQILGDVLVTFVLEEMDRLSLTPSPMRSAVLVSRLHQAVSGLAQTTVETFVTLYTETITEQARRLEDFTRMAAHEWRQPLSTLQFGVTLLQHADLDPSRVRRTWEAVERNVAHLIDVTRKLETIARLHGQGDTPLVQEIQVATVAHEAARQLRDMADARDVRIEIADDLPSIVVDVGRLELVLVNLLSNGIKYADSDKDVKRVEVSGSLDESGSWCRIDVRDNGVGIPSHALGTVFKRFTRAHAEHDDLSHVAGIGLGLAIVHDSVRAMGGDVEVESEEHVGTCFSVRLPVRPGAPAA